MRIAHVIASMDPSFGGPPMVAARLAAAQAMQGATVSIHSWVDPGARGNLNAMLSRVPGASAIQLEFVAASGGLFSLIGGVLREVGRNIAGHSDVLHLHGVWDPILLAAAAAARRVGRPYVVTPHGMLDPWCLAQGRLKKRVALALRFRRMLSEAACLHLLNRDERDGIAPLRLSTRTAVIPNGVFLEEIDPLPTKGEFRSRHAGLGQRPFVLFLSRLHFKKGLDYLADAFALVASIQPDLRLVVAGPDDGAKSDFESRISRAGLTERVHMLGPIYGPEKLGAFVDAACFCLPSRQEGFSIAITEALACGTPVIISEACHFPEVEEADAGLVVPLRSDAIADAIARIIEEPGRARQMGDRGRALVQERYTWPVIASKCVDLYESVLSERSR